MRGPSGLRSHTDEELSLLGGAGVDELFRRHNQALSRFCLGITGRADEAADATQTVWERALVTFSTRRGAVANVRPWLYTVARNECLDQQRAGGAGAMVDIGDIELPAGLTPQETLEQRGEVEMLLHDLAGLSERQRAALVLREFAGFAADELAGVLGTSPARALGLVTEARRGLVARRSGRGLPCSTAQRELTRMRRRSAGLQAHLDSCADCRAFERRRRGRALSSLSITPLIFLRGLAERLPASAPPELTKAAVATAVVAGSLGLSGVPVGDHAVRPAQGTPRVAAIAPAAVSPTLPLRAPRAAATAATQRSSGAAAPRRELPAAVAQTTAALPTATAPAPTPPPPPPPSRQSSPPLLPADVDPSLPHLDESVRSTVGVTGATAQDVIKTADVTLDMTAAKLSALRARTR
ncbi:MAG: RNA polymerase sigma factor [Thermoleophilia bacterium]